jgi:hypothetical protein
VTTEWETRFTIFMNSRWTYFWLFYFNFIYAYFFFRENKISNFVF